MKDKLFARKTMSALQIEADSSPLRRSLGVFDITMLGIGAIIGTGIFVLTGEAAAGTEHALGAGPALTISFVITGLACAFAALCYAEFAAMVPVSGSAYTYSYASFGELIAWIIGWDLVLEYAVGNVAVAIGWSGYFKNMLDGFGIYMPGWMCGATGTDMVLLPTGQWTAMGPAVLERFGEAASTYTHTTAIFNFPALLITFLVTTLLLIGIRESARVNALLVVVKLALVTLFLIFGVPHFNPDIHWQEFAPNGWKGIMAGAALVFFAYIGFDAVSTTAEEARNPQRDLPIGMMLALLICTLLYVAVAAVLTGMVPLSILDNEKPVVEALAAVGENKIALLIATGVVLTMPTVLLVMQLGQIRIFYTMSRDGLLSPRFSKIHQKFRTPSFATIVVGIFVGVFAATVDIGAAAELTNIGTLFAFVLVATGVWILRVKQPGLKRRFRTPAYRVTCFLCIAICLSLMLALPLPTWIRFFVWMAIGISIYFLYGIKHSKLRQIGSAPQ
ncbi:MAG TPA: amino acid permease [Saprospiraceae bacterium]|nr:amino acid permease [Saprospiraceae bacterium]